jgi:hypothetical protein
VRCVYELIQINTQPLTPRGSSAAEMAHRQGVAHRGIGLSERADRRAGAAEAHLTVTERASRGPRIPGACGQPFQDTATDLISLAPFVLRMGLAKGQLLDRAITFWRHRCNMASMQQEYGHVGVFQDRLGTPSENCLPE